MVRARAVQIGHFKSRAVTLVEEADTLDESWSMVIMEDRGGLRTLLGRYRHRPPWPLRSGGWAKTNPIRGLVHGYLI